jgi:hypothetical protein
MPLKFILICLPLQRKTRRYVPFFSQLCELLTFHDSCSLCLGNRIIIYLTYFQVISTWGAKNKIDFLSLSYTRHAKDVREVVWAPDCLLELVISYSISINRPSYVFLMQARDFLSKLGDLSQTQIFAKIENVEVSYISSCLCKLLYSYWQA